MAFRINTNLWALGVLRNLNNTSDELAKSMARLSSGLRIVSAADDPAGLMISENLRAQIAGLEQALRNNQDAINYAKTAEGALEEVSRLLDDARRLALSSANTGVLDQNAIQANQNQINSIIESINRIAQQTQFGTKKLLDGSAGVFSYVTDTSNYDAINIGGTFGGYTVNTDGDVTVQVTTAAAKARVTGSVDFSLSGLNTTVGAGTFVINGITFVTDGTETLGSLLSRFNNSSSTTGVTFFFNGTNVVMQSNDYGSNAKISFTDTEGRIHTAGNTTVYGTDAVATVTVTTTNGATSVVFTGGRGDDSGLRLTDTYGNSITLTEQGNIVGGASVAGRIEVGSSTFQIGANAGQTVSLSLPNIMASQLGDGVVSGLNLSLIDVTTQQGAEDALKVIDAAIEEISKLRGEIGSFQRNVLESNVRSLGVAHENIVATESAIRDLDVAAEVTNYTKLQILQQAGLSVLAQANALPSAVLALLS